MIELNDFGYKLGPQHKAGLIPDAEVTPTKISPLAIFLLNSINLLRDKKKQSKDLNNSVKKQAAVSKD